MATDLLVSTPGLIRVVPAVKVVPAGFTVSVEGMTNGGSAYTQLRAIVNGLGLSEQAAVQITHSLRDMVYVYAFGDRMGDMQIRGLAMLADCKNPNESGFSKVYRYFRANRPGKRRTPITVSLGTSFSVRGILLDLTMSIQDSQIPVANFSMNMRYFPDAST